MSEDEERGAARAVGRAGRLLAPLLRVRLFYKILIANALIVILGAVAGTALTAAFVRAEPARSTLELVGLLAAAGVVVSVLVNAAILRLALSPLALLERTAARVQAGGTDVRAPRSPLADRELERLTRTFNGMLDSLAAYRRRLRAMAARALGAQEEERKRVARELHDETAQALAALLIRLRVARGVEDAAAREAMLDAVRDELAAALEGVRRFARGLRPPALDELGLVPALASHARMLRAGAAPEVRIEAEGIAGALAPEAELALYRIAQEALSNAVRHAGATRVVLRIGVEAGRVVAAIEDDGRGFAADAVARDGAGMGLFGMQERAAYVGGRVTIDARPGRGTRVRVEVPAAAAAG